MSQSKDNIIKNAIILFLITVIAGTLLGFTYEITKEPIKVQEKKQKDAALQTVIPDATFELMSADLEQFPNIGAVYSAKIADEIVGYAFELTSPEGYGGDVQLVAGINIDGNITGIDIIKHAETPGLGAKADEAEFKNNFLNKKAQPLKIVKGTATEENDVIAISGATITSRAVMNVVNDAVDYFTTEIGQVK